MVELAETVKEVRLGLNDMINPAFDSCLSSLTCVLFLLNTAY